MPGIAMSGLGYSLAGAYAVAIPLLALLMAVIKTNPDEIRSNISKYLEWAGVHRIPEWLRSRGADQLVFRWAAVSMAFLITIGVGFGLGALVDPFALPPQKFEASNTAPGPQGGPIGPIAAVKFTQIFNTVPKPCTVRLTSPPNSELAKTFSWLLTHGGPKADVICNVDQSVQMPNVDEPFQEKIAESGIVIHWDDSFEVGAKITHWFDAIGFKIGISHRLPPHSAPTLIWIDIGNGSPWK
jgi:hypothetical protein